MDNVREISLLFRTVCRELLCKDGKEGLDTRLSVIKEHFFNRRYREIFTTPELVPVYAAVYGPSRALAILDILDTNELLSEAVKDEDGWIYCLGAGSGSELAAILCHCSASNAPGALLHIQDLSDNIELLSRFPLAGSTPKARLECSVGDVLDENNVHLDECISKASLITASFLLNELLATSKRDFVRFLGRLIHSMRKGALLLVIDSAGSFSKVGVSSKEYMCFDLLDNLKAFEILESTNSRWFRLPERDMELVPGIKLQNMRYFMRLYRKV
ncbi:MAG: hypothetical protein SGCHY_001242 [Lobulomycetales sp.]